MGVKSPWENYLNRRGAPLGFLTKTQALRGEPSEAEKFIALAIEIDKWQSSKGNKGFTVGAEYSVSKGHTILNNEKWEKRIPNAIEAYVKTPMDPDNILRALGYDIDKYENPPTMAQKLITQIKLYAPQAIIVSTMLLMLYLILKEIK